METLGQLSFVLNEEVEKKSDCKFLSAITTTAAILQSEANELMNSRADWTEQARKEMQVGRSFSSCSCCYISRVKQFTGE